MDNDRLDKSNYIITWIMSEEPWNPLFMYKSTAVKIEVKLGFSISKSGISFGLLEIVKNLVETIE